MQFHSILFALFFPTVFVVYWFIGGNRVRGQNIWLLAANCVFYGAWDYRFLLLLFAAAMIDYGIGLALGREESPHRRRFWLIVSLIVNLGLLGFFKYCNFFIESFADVLSAVGLHPDVHMLNIILPLGISFYTFQRLSYGIDLYRGQTKPVRDLIAFLTFSSFFLLVVAGPIERGKRLLPQLLKPREFDLVRSKDGLRQILWGLFKKIVIADNLATPVNAIFKGYASATGIDLGVGVFLFAVQIYADFSAYSDIAMGCGKLLGFRIMRNFNYPYFSRDIAEFWRRWHISMSSWFRDYVYTPLSLKTSFFNRSRRIWNILATFTVSGLWHGAGWTYVFWGFVNGLYFVPQIWTRSEHADHGIVAEGRLIPSWHEAMKMTVTFAFVLLAWVLFRTESLATAFDYYGCMFTGNWLAIPQNGWPLMAGGGLLGLEWIRRDKVHMLEIESLPVVARWGVYCTVILAILVLGQFGEQGFYYAQF